MPAVTPLAIITQYVEDEMRIPTRARVRHFKKVQRRDEWPEELKELVAEIRELPVPLQAVVLEVWRQLLRGCRIAKRFPQPGAAEDEIPAVAFLQMIERGFQAVDRV